MPLRRELRQRLAKEYRYAANKMQETNDISRKLFYFSVIFSEAQRILNWQWDRNLALLYAVAQFSHTQISGSMKVSATGQTLPINWSLVFEKLTTSTSDFASYFENTEDDVDSLIQVLGHLAEITYSAFGNGIYLSEKGAIQL